MTVNTLAELNAAVKANEAEITVADEKLAAKVRLWNTLRAVANIAVIVILAIGIFAWADPLGLPFLKEPWAHSARRIVLIVGVALLFADYLLPAVRTYKPASSDALGLKLVPRKPK